MADFEVTAEGTAVQLLSAGRPYSIPVLPAGAGCWATPAPRRRLPLSPRARPRRRPGRCPVMDPDQALRDLRAALTALRHAIDNDTGDVAGHASTVLDLFTGLDHWLTTAASYRPTGSRPPASTRPKGSDRDDRSRRHALIIPPVGPPHTQQIGSEDLTALQQLVGGLIEAVSRYHWHAYLNDEGKLLALPANPIATALLFPDHADTIAGTAVLLGEDTAGQEADVPPGLIDIASALWARRPITGQTHRWIGADDDQQCLNCGLTIPDDGADILPSRCPATETGRPHILTHGLQPALECGYCTLTITAHTNYPDIDFTCPGNPPADSPAPRPAETSVPARTRSGRAPCRPDRRPTSRPRRPAAVRVRRPRRTHHPEHPLSRRVTSLATPLTGPGPPTASPHAAGVPAAALPVTGDPRTSPARRATAHGLATTVKINPTPEATSREIIIVIAGSTPVARSEQDPGSRSSTRPINRVRIGLTS